MIALYIMAVAIGSFPRRSSGAAVYPHDRVLFSACMWEHWKSRGHCYSLQHACGGDIWSWFCPRKWNCHRFSGALFYLRGHHDGSSSGQLLKSGAVIHVGDAVLLLSIFTSSSSCVSQRQGQFSLFIFCGFMLNSSSIWFYYLLAC